MCHFFSFRLAHFKNIRLQRERRGRCSMSDTSSTGKMKWFTLVGGFLVGASTFVYQTVGLMDSPRVMSVIDERGVGSGDTSAKLDNLAQTVSSTPSGIGVTMAATSTADSIWASRLNTHLAQALATATSGAYGYRVSGQISDSRITPGGEAEFRLTWALSKGRISKDCGTVSVRFLSSMPSLAEARVAESIRPFLRNSVDFEDVRC